MWWQRPLYECKLEHSSFPFSITKVSGTKNVAIIYSKIKDIKVKQNNPL